VKEFLADDTDVAEYIKEKSFSQKYLIAMEELENKISYDIRGAAFQVYNELGPGLLESVYEATLAFELSTMGYKVKTQVPLPVEYKDVKMELGFRLDILVDDQVIIEIKSVEELTPVHYKQLLTYLRLADKKLGMLINFNTDKIAGSIKRVVNGL